MIRELRYKQPGVPRHSGIMMTSARAAVLPQLLAVILTCFATACCLAQTQPTLPPQPPPRVPQSAMGIAQLPNEKLQWLLDDKLGMFIHWGLYSGPGRGEWMMEHEGMAPQQYRRFAYPEGGDAYFDAADYHADA